MNTDNVIIAWGLLLVAFSIVGLTGAIFYYAGKKTKKH